VIAEVGRGKLTVEKARSYLNGRSKEPAALTAPPSGLFLERIYYPHDKKLMQLTPVLPITSERTR
jgi:tRNA pseudouridine38-40 synthase